MIVVLFVCIVWVERIVGGTGQHVSCARDQDMAMNFCEFMQEFHEQRSPLTRVNFAFGSKSPIATLCSLRFTLAVLSHMHARESNSPAVRRLKLGVQPEVLRGQS